MLNASATKLEKPRISTISTSSPPPPAPATTAKVVMMPSNPPKMTVFMCSDAADLCASVASTRVPVSLVVAVPPCASIDKLRSPCVYASRAAFKSRVGAMPASALLCFKTDGAVRCAPAGSDIDTVPLII
eukprot:2517152-Pleurochrysis_carterae.AAC.6